MKRFWLIGLVFLSGCQVVPGTPQVTSNTAAKVEALFDVDGYRMYRFEDGSQNIYFVLPAKGERVAIAQTYWSTVESCGKNCTKIIPHSVKTAVR